jgi:phage shock protein A
VVNAQKRSLFEELSREEHEIDEVRRQADEAKGELVEQRRAIGALERERLQALTTIAEARARRRIQGALAELSAEQDTSALDAVWEELARIAAERTLDRELGLTQGLT